MTKRLAVKPKPRSGRSRKTAQMIRAHEIAAKGMRVSFSAMLMQFDESDRTTLMLYG